MKFEVDTNQLSTTVKSLQDALNEISDNRIKMYSAIEALDGMWMGQAHDAFLTQYENDNEMLIALIQDIDTVFENYGIARKNYDDCEESAKDIARQIRI